MHIVPLASVSRADARWEMFVEQFSILIVSDAPEFAEPLLQIWQRRQYASQFSVARAHVSGEFPGCAVVVLDGSSGLTRLGREVQLAIVITDDEQLPEVGGTDERVVQIQRKARWAEHAAVLAAETVLRLEAEQRATKAERELTEAERFAVLGRFFLDSRHELGNALTCILGNAELVLLNSDPGVLEEVRGQMETVRAMSLRVYGILQQLSALDMERQVAERQVKREMLQGPRQVAAPQ